MADGPKTLRNTHICANALHLTIKLSTRIHRFRSPLPPRPTMGPQTSSRSGLTIVLLLTLSCIAYTQAQESSTVTWTARWWADYPDEDKKELTMHHVLNGHLLVQGLDRDDVVASGAWFRIRAANEKLLSIEKSFNGSEVSVDGQWQGMFEMDALFLGLTNVYVEKVSAAGEPIERSDTVLPIIIVREVRTIDHVFTGSVATLVSLLYINFGAALSLSKLKGIVRRPIGPAIGFVGQFVIMPLVRLSTFVDTIELFTQ